MHSPEGFTPDFTREAGEFETERQFVGGQEFVESEEVGPDGKRYKVKRTRNSTGGFAENREEIKTPKPQPAGAGNGGGGEGPINVYEDGEDNSDDKKIPADIRKYMDNTSEGPGSTE